MNDFQMKYKGSELEALVEGSASSLFYAGTIEAAYSIPGNNGAQVTVSQAFRTKYGIGEDKDTFYIVDKRMTSVGDSNVLYIYPADFEGCYFVMGDFEGNDAILGLGAAKGDWVVVQGREWVKIITTQREIAGISGNVTAEALATKLSTPSQELPNPLATTTQLNNKVDIVKGKGLSTNDYTNEDKEQVDTIREALLATKNVDLSEAIVGIWNVDTNAFLSTNNFFTIRVPIDGRCKVSYSGYNGGTSMAMIIVRDADGNIIRFYDRGDGSYTERSGTIYIEESEATEIIFTYRRNFGSPYLHISELIDFDSLVQKVDDAEMICKDYMVTRKEFIAKKSPNLWDGTTIDKVISTSGNLTYVSSWQENKSSTPIEVKPNAYYYLSGRPAGISTKAIRCLSRLDGAGLKVLSPVTNTEYAGSFNLPNDDATDIKVNGMFKTPADAKYVQFVVAAGDPYSYDKVMLEYVGEEYDENFQPSPYQPYNPMEVIKKDKLPDDIPNTNADNAVARKYPLKVLLIGSSHGMNSISQFPWICYKSGFNVTVGNVYKGSLTLQQVAQAINNSTSIGGWFKVFADGAWQTKETTLFDDVIRSADWDFVIVQRSASDDNIWSKEQSDALFTIISRINEVSTNTPTILFNSGFADPASDAEVQKTITNTIMSTAMEMQLEHQIEVIPLATAIQNARGTSLANIGAYAHKDMCYDSQHLDYGIGCYVASATIVQAILAKYGWDILTMKGYGTYDEAKSFVGTLVDTGGEGVAYTEPTDETIRIAKLCAKAAYLKPTEVNDRLAELFPI